MMRKRILVLLPLVLGAASSSPPGAELASPTPVFTPERFFSGRTESSGTLKIVLRGEQTLRVRGTGHVEGDTLVIEQLVERTGVKPERKLWHIKKLASGRYAGTLSDAVGPLAGSLAGNRLHLKYRLKEGKVDVDQGIYLQPDGKTAINRMTLSRVGFKVGTIQETIRRID